jgi:hypothetical protein
MGHTLKVHAAGGEFQFETELELRAGQMIELTSTEPRA